ncbi:DUF4328 domain-containing protein [Mycolicibacterium canariasense]|uniref:DUF4328 domain-containing protein n=1 Tax=Mycolicibacterium canariasense TaxID=228230 RepID=UPI0007880618|nr:DUF4328 domain-containing protein [Mycolicibacterium canariasense]MCV7207370.1 DUF4328 domain-containing protein [Mycolicibacterium canariasense]ORV19404.1 hypothetical protein AWB94_02770 [Mycolicibacterium canariasense]
MIQVCAQCGTRWNVRDRQRVWCPRCRGTLLAPGVLPPVPPQPGGPDPRWRPPAGAPSRPPARPQPGPLPQGFKWIAVRPGAAPPPRRQRRPLGPTPRYASIPRWSLYGPPGDYAPGAAVDAEARRGPSATMVRATLVTTMALLGFAAVMHILRYALLLINRSVLLNPVLAGVVTWVGVAASALALFGVIVTAVVLTNWLIARRAGVFAHNGRDDPRSKWQLWAGCLVPLVNLFWAPVFLIELARAEGRTGLRITAWWITWVFSTAVSVMSIATSFVSDAQGIANNTVTTTIAYLLALAAVVLVLQVFQGFESRPVDRPVKRWVMVATGPQDGESAVHETDSAPAVETEDQNPAA